MSLEVATPRTEAEMAAHRRAIATAFGQIPGTDDQTMIDQQRALVEQAHTVAVLDTGEIIGGLSGAEFDLTLPGGASVRAAGVAGVGLNPARTGRGGLRAMMEEHLRRCVSRGLAASTLWASESGLYGRFGYGPATTLAIHELTVEGAQFRTPPGSGGRSDIIFDREQARRLVTEIYGRYVGQTPGATSRSEAWWDMVFSSPDGWLSPGPRLALIHWNDRGQPDGYALYKVVDPHGGDSWICDGVVSVREFVGLSIEAERALVDFLKAVPLCRRIRFDMTPVAFPLRHHLADPRRLHQIEAHDGLWVRPLDVPQLLGARRYQTSGQVKLEIADPLFPAQRGPWELQVHDGSATITPTSSADVMLTPGQLGATLLGDTRVGELVDAGQIEGDQAAQEQLDILLVTRRKPFSFSKF